MTTSKSLSASKRASSTGDSSLDELLDSTESDAPEPTDSEHKTQTEPSHFERFKSGKFALVDEGGHELTPAIVFRASTNDLQDGSKVNYVEYVPVEVRMTTDEKIKLMDEPEKPDPSAVKGSSAATASGL